MHKSNLGKGQRLILRWQVEKSKCCHRKRGVSHSLSWQIQASEGVTISNNYSIEKYEVNNPLWFMQNKLSMHRLTWDLFAKLQKHGWSILSNWIKHFFIILFCRRHRILSRENVRRHFKLLDMKRTRPPYPWYLPYPWLRGFESKMQRHTSSS